MNLLRSHIAALINQNQTYARSDLAYQYKKMVVQRFLTGNIFAFLIQYIGLTMSTLSFIFMPLWISSGTALALIFLRGPRILPGIGLGSIVAYYFANSGILHAMECAGLFTFQAYALFRLNYRYASPTLIFYQKKLFFTFFLLSALITAITSYLLSIIFYSAFKNHFTQLQICLQWWLANLNGLIIFACAIMTWDAHFPQIDRVKKQIYLLVGSFGAILFCFILLFTVLLVHQTLSISVFIFAFFSFLLTMSVSIRFGWCGIIAALFLQGLVLPITVFFIPTIVFSHFYPVLYLQVFILFEIIIGVYGSRFLQFCAGGNSY